MIMKLQTKLYFRTTYITLIVLLCICLGWIGVSSAYENTVQTAYGKYQKAIEISSDTIRILDFVIKK